MFKCPVTKKAVGPNVSPIQVVLKTRKKYYSNFNPITMERVESEGWEIVREAFVSQEGLEILKQKGLVK